MADATIDGIRTHYEIHGDGEPVLMYSPGGFDASLDKWSGLGVYERTKMLKHLSRSYQCIIFDRRETGQSGGRIERISWDDYVAQGAGLLDHLGIERAHLLGGCMGVCPVTVHAVRHPERVISQILYWPVGGARFRMRGHERFAKHLAMVDSEGMQGVADLALASTEGFGKDPRVGPWAPVIRTDSAFAKHYADYDVPHYKAIVEGMSRLLLDRDTAPGAEPEDMLRLDIPTLVVPGKDVAHATSAARYLEECIPGAEYVDMPPEEQTESTIPPLLLDFLKQHPA